MRSCRRPKTPRLAELCLWSYCSTKIVQDNEKIWIYLKRLYKQISWSYCRAGSRGTAAESGLDEDQQREAISAVWAHQKIFIVIESFRGKKAPLVTAYSLPWCNCAHVCKKCIVMHLFSILWTQQLERKMPLWSFFIPPKRKPWIELHPWTSSIHRTPQRNEKFSAHG